MLGHDCSDECVIYKWDKLCLKKNLFSSIINIQYSLERLTHSRKGKEKCTRESSIKQSVQNLF